MIKSESNAYNNLIHIQSRYNRNKENNIKGLLSDKEHEVKLNQINISIIKFIDDLKKVDLK